MRRSRLDTKEAAVKIGDKVRFRPAVFEGVQNNVKNGPGGKPLPVHVTGEIVRIHAEHRWFRVRYQMAEGTPVRHECFKF